MAGKKGNNKKNRDAGKVYKIIEVVGTSDGVISDAIENAIRKASETLHNLDWFEVAEIRGAIVDNRPVFQVKVKIGFRLD